MLPNHSASPTTPAPAPIGAPLRHRLRGLLLVLITLSTLLLPALAGAVTLTFSSDSGLQDGIAHPGDGGSAAIPGKGIEIISTMGSSGLPTTGLVYRPDYVPGFPVITNDSAAQGFVIRSNNGSRFAFRSLRQANWGDITSMTATYHVTGWRAGQVVASGSLFSSWNDGNPQTYIASGDFADVDEVRILHVSGGANDGGGSWIGINDIVIEDAVAATAPTVTSVGTLAANGTYRAGTVIQLLVNFDQSVSVTGTPQLMLNTGNVANYTSGNTTNQMRFSYTVQPGDNVTRLDAASMTALNANGGRIRGVIGGADAVLALPAPGAAGSLGASAAIALDAVAPTVLSVRGSPTTGTYKAGDEVTLLVTMSEPVTVAGSTMRLPLTLGAQTSAAVYVSGSGTSTLTFRYAVQAGHESTRLDHPAGASITTVNTTLADAAGNEADRTLPTPGSANALGGTSTLVVDGVSPRVLSIVPDPATPASATSVPFLVTFNKPVTGLHAGNFNVASNGVVPTSVALAGSGADYVVTVGVGNSNGTIRVNLVANAAIVDAVGNPVTAGFTGAIHTVSTAIINPPAAPTIGTVTAGINSASVPFTAPMQDGGAAITGYVVTTYPGGATTSGSGSPITVSGLNGGQGYYFTVRAENSAGLGNPSANSNTVTPLQSQVIVFHGPGPMDVGTSATLSATSNSGLAVVYSSTTTDVCTVTSEGSLVAVAAGNCLIDADQPGNTFYGPAPTASASIVINAVAPGAPTITRVSQEDGQLVVHFTPGATGGRPITNFQLLTNPGNLIVNGTTSPLTVSGLTNGQDYTIGVRATNQAGLTGPAGVLTGTVTPRARQTIDFPSVPQQAFGSTTTLAATSSAGLPVTYRTRTPLQCEVDASSGEVRYLLIGDCEIDVYQSGTAAIAAATPAYQRITVVAVPPGEAANLQATAGDREATVSFDVPAFTGGAPVTYTLSSTPAGVTVQGSGSPLTMTGLDNGTAYVFRVTASNSAGMGALSSPSTSVTPSGGQTISFSDPGDQPFDAALTLSASASSGLQVTLASTTPQVCTISGTGVLAFASIGTCTITADQAGDAAHQPATQVSHSFAVLAVRPGMPTSIVATSTAPGTASVAFAAPASSGGAPILGYTVTVSPGGATQAGTASPILVSGLPNGVAHTFTVTARTSAGLGDASADSNPVTSTGTQTISFADPGNQPFGTSTTLSASASSGLAVTLASGTPAVCAIDATGVLTFSRAGTCTITADQAGNLAFAPAAQVRHDFEVTAVLPGMPTAVVATGTASGTATVAFTAPVATGGVPIIDYTVTVSPGGATHTGSGSPIVVSGLDNGVVHTFTVTARNSAGQGAASAASAGVTPTATQSISFTAPGDQAFGTTPTLSATASSGLPVTLASTTPQVCSINGTGVSGTGVLAFASVGTCTITAEQAGDAAFESAPRVTHSFQVTTVAAGAPGITSVEAGAGSVTVRFTAPAFTGGTQINDYTVTAQPGNHTVSGSGSPIQVSGLANGTAYTLTVVANTSAGPGAPSSASASVIPMAVQSISFAQPTDQAFGTTPTLSATASSGLPVTLASSTPQVCTINGGGVSGAGVLTFVRTGTCTIDADQAGDVGHLAAARVSRSFEVTAQRPGAPTSIVATSTASGTATVAFAAPVSTGGAAILDYTVTVAPGGATHTGTASPIVVSGLANGVAHTFTVTARNSAGQGDPSVASNAVTPIGTQTISFAAPGNQAFGTTPTLAATASSGLPVTLASSTPQVCTISGAGAGAGAGVLAFASVGTCTITADQAGDAAFEAAARVSHSFAVTAVRPGVPTAIVATTTGTGTASVAFSAPASTGGAPILDYTVTVAPGGATQTGTTSPIVVSGLANGVAHTFTVTARSSGGQGDPSVASNAVTATATQAISFSAPGNQTFGTTPTLTATASSGLPVTLASSTPQVCTISGAGMSGAGGSGAGVLAFASVGTCTITADQAGNAAFEAAQQVSHSFSVAAALPGAPTIGTATVASPGSVSVAFTAPAITGGAPIQSYTVTAQPGGQTSTGIGSPIVVTGLTAGQAYTFSVTATTAAGTGTPSQASNTVRPVPTLHAGAVTLSVAYGAAAAPVTLDITGTATAVQVVSPPQHGTAVVSGTTISYQPTAGYAGPDSFSYTASDAWTTSGAATVSITVTAPTVAMELDAPAAGMAGTAYQHGFRVSGGTAPYSYRVASGSLPAGLVLGAAGELVGTPTEAGTFTFTIEATDSSTGLGPFSAQRQLSLTIAAPSMALDPVDDGAYGEAYRRVLRATGGVAPYSFSVASGTLPTGVTLSADGVLEGTPTQAGNHAVSIAVRDANGFTSTLALAWDVAQAEQAITAFSADPGTPVFTANGTFALTAQAGGSSSPVQFASTTPAVCTVNGALVTMLAVGRCSLTATQAGDANHRAAAAVTLDIDIASMVPVLEWDQTLQKVLGEPAFEIALPRSPSAGAFTFTSSDTAVATISGRMVTLQGEGSTRITVQQAASGGYAAASADLILVVQVRPDPTRDATVLGLLQAQVDASVRFANTQQSNIRDRLRQVRSGTNGTSNSLNLSYAGEGRQSLSVPLNQTPMPALPQGWGTWAAGSATWGRGGNAARYDLTSDGISVGVDRALGETLLLGVVGGMGHNSSEFDDARSRMSADQQSLAVYGLWRIGDRVFVDGMVGSGRLDFSMRRWSNEAQATGVAERDGSQWFGSLAFGYDHRSDALTLTGYGRVDASRSTLDAYGEQGLGMYDLVYRRQQVRNSALALGMEGSVTPGEGRVRPFWSVEYRQALNDRGDADMNYATWQAPTDYRAALNSYNDNALSLSAGLDIKVRRGWLLSLLVGHEQARGADRSNSVGLRLSSGTGAGAGAAPGMAARGGMDGDDGDAAGVLGGSGPQALQGRCPPRGCPGEVGTAR